MKINKKMTGSNTIKNQQIVDLLDNLPVGVCVLFMPDDMHQELRFAIVKKIVDFMDGRIEAARKAGMDSYITKPIVPMVLYKTMFENLASCARR